MMQRTEYASMRIDSCPCTVDIDGLYCGFDAVGLQYGPQYRTVVSAWGGDGRGATARLRSRPSRHGTAVHPADLDDALCIGVIASDGNGEDETRLPFAVDDALLQRSSGSLAALVERHEGADAIVVQLGAVASRSQSRLDGFKSRALRAAKVQSQRHLYFTAWHSASLAQQEAGRGPRLVLSDVKLGWADWEQLKCGAARAAIVARLAASAWATVTLVAAMQRGNIDFAPLRMLEVALSLVQAQATSAAAPLVSLITAGLQLPREVRGAAQGSMWGLARSARAEAQLPVLCLNDASQPTLERTPSIAEPEQALLRMTSCVPRLVRAPGTVEPDAFSAHSWGGQLVTGGTGGLGLLTGRWLTQLGVRTLVLASRGGAVAHQMSDEWKQLQASGGAARIERCDTAEQSHTRRVMAPTDGLQRIAGMWHCAGVLADGILPRQSAGSLARVCSPKAQGAWMLQLAGLPIPLQVCVLFSSAAALLGGAGQANYSAANAWLDAIASSQLGKGRASVSVQWGAWSEVGMAARGAASERMAVIEAESGFGRINLAQGLGAMHAAVLPQSSSPLGVIPVQWNRMLGGGGPVPAFLCEMAPKSLPVRATSAAVQQPAASGATISLKRYQSWDITHLSIGPFLY
jgi:hypothetical protein